MYIHMYMYRCNILIRYHFPVHIKGTHKWNTPLCMPFGYVVHHLACTAQARVTYRNELG